MVVSDAMPDHAADTDALMLSIWVVTDCAMPVQAVDTEVDTPDHAVCASTSTPDHALEVSVFIWVVESLVLPVRDKNNPTPENRSAFLCILRYRHSLQH